MTTATEFDNVTQSVEPLDPIQARPSLGSGDSDGADHRGRPKVALGLIRLYQLARGPRPSPCRFLPTCSQYAEEAIREYGTIRGGALAARRIARCHPWGGHGIDPMPVREARSE